MPRPNTVGEYMIYISTQTQKKKNGKEYEYWRISIKFWNNKLKRVWRYDKTYNKKKYTLEDVVKFRDKVIKDNTINMSRNDSEDLTIYNILNGTNLKKLPTNSEQEQEIRDYFYNRYK